MPDLIRRSPVLRESSEMVLNVEEVTSHVKCVALRRAALGDRPVLEKTCPPFQKQLAVDKITAARKVRLMQKHRMPFALLPSAGVPNLTGSLYQVVAL